MAALVPAIYVLGCDRATMRVLLLPLPASGERVGVRGEVATFLITRVLMKWLLTRIAAQSDLSPLERGEVKITVIASEAKQSTLCKIENGLLRR